MNKGTVSYNRSERKWEYEDYRGNTKIFEGPDAKAQAQDHRMAVEVKNVYEAINKMRDNIEEELSKRAHKAGLIIADGNVINPTAEERKQNRFIRARIGVTTATVEYLITVEHDDNLYTCTCIDWAKGWQMVNLPSLDPNRPSTGAPYLNNVGVMCKHTLAYHLNMYTERAMSLMNPQSDFLAQKLWDILMKEFRGEELGDLLLTLKPVSFGQGAFKLRATEASSAYFELAPEQVKKLASAVSQATAASQVLEMV